MSIASGNVHPDAWEIEVFLNYSLKGFRSYNGDDYLTQQVKDFIEGEAYEITEQYEDIDLINLSWTLESMELRRGMRDQWDLTGNMSVKANVVCSRQRYAEARLKEAIKEVFHPCSGDLTIVWNSWVIDVAEGAAA